MPPRCDALTGITFNRKLREHIDVKGNSKKEREGIESGEVGGWKRLLLGVAFAAFGVGRPSGDLLDVTDPAFATYALATSLGPISGLTPFALNLFTSLASSLGAITMPTSGPVTFQATTGAAPPPVASTPVPTLSEYGLLLLVLLTGTVAMLPLRSRLR